MKSVLISVLAFIAFHSQAFALLNNGTPSNQFMPVEEAFPILERMNQVSNKVPGNRVQWKAFQNLMDQLKDDTKVLAKTQKGSAFRDVPAGSVEIYPTKKFSSQWAAQDEVTRGKANLLETKILLTYDFGLLVNHKSSTGDSSLLTELLVAAEVRIITQDCVDLKTCEFVQVYVDSVSFQTMPIARPGVITSAGGN